MIWKLASGTEKDSLQAGGSPSLGQPNLSSEFQNSNATITIQNKQTKPQTLRVHPGPYSKCFIYPIVECGLKSPGETLNSC